MSNIYWEGRIRVILGRRDVPQERHWEERRQIMNRAFELFYNGRQVLNNHRLNFDTREDMRKDLEKAAKVGWKIIGDPADLEGAMKGLWDNKNKTGPWWKWTMRMKQTQMGSQQIFGRGISLPESVANFLIEASKRIVKISNYFEVLDAYTDRADRALDNDDWSSLQTNLGHIASGAERIEKYGWLAPANASNSIEAVGKIGELVGKINDAMNIAADLASGNRLDASLKTVALVVDHLPVLGELYATALRSIPEIGPRMEQSMQRYHDRANRRIPRGARFRFGD